ncbi:MAG: glycosyltransferase [Acidobacteria bacterium]|nr:MAG: glycosyltransferase [Acidobacteriota bacterium]
MSRFAARATDAARGGVRKPCPGFGQLDRTGPASANGPLRPLRTPGSASGRASPRQRRAAPGTAAESHRSLGAAFSVTARKAPPGRRPRGLEFRFPAPPERGGTTTVASGKGAAGPRLSAAIITRNEAHNLPRLLEALRGVADEVVVVDSGSDDGTPEIARRFGARVIETDWPGFGLQKQRALAACRGEWVLSIDADEVPDEALAAALSRLPPPDSTTYRGFAVDRLTWYLGDFLRHVWSPDWITRVVRRGAGRFTDSRVHERLVVDGPVGRLPGRLLHYSFRDLSDHIERTVRYARLGAQELERRGRRSRAVDLALRPAASFVQRYLLKRGFLDGYRGLIAAGVTAAGTFFKYAFLFERSLARNGGEKR